MTDENWKLKEAAARSRAAEAFTYKRPEAAQPPVFKELKISPEANEALKRSAQSLKERAVARFKVGPE